jgi:hypothetical protein
LAARGDWNAALLAQAAVVAADEHDDDAHQLLRDAAKWIPRKN